MEFNLTTRELPLAMLLALGVAVILRDVFKAIDVLAMAHEYKTSDPNRLAEEALEHLGMTDKQREEQREEEQDVDDGA